MTKCYNITNVKSNLLFQIIFLAGGQQRETFISSGLHYSGYYKCYFFFFFYKSSMHTVNGVVVVDVMNTIQSE